MYAVSLMGDVIGWLPDIIQPNNLIIGPGISVFPGQHKCSQSRLKPRSQDRGTSPDLSPSTSAVRSPEHPPSAPPTSKQQTYPSPIRNDPTSSTILYTLQRPYPHPYLRLLFPSCQGHRRHQRAAQLLGGCRLRRMLPIPQSRQWRRGGGQG